MTERAPAAAVRPEVALGLVLAVGAAHAWRYAVPFEDAFITYRYAENLGRGVGLVYNPGEVVEGFTSFGWTVLLAGVARVGLALPAVAPVLSLACGLAVLAATWALARRWLGRADLWAVVPALLVAAEGTWAYYAMSGMETMLFVLLLLVAARLATDADAARAGGWTAGLAAAGAALVRPEGAAYFAVIAAALGVCRADRRIALRATLAFAAVFAPYFAWRWHHFGWPLPNTYYAKSELSVAVALRGARQLECYATTHLAWLVPAALIVVIRRRGATRGWRIAAALAGASAANDVLVGGDAFAFYRFLLPAIPAAAIALTGAALALGETRSAARRGAIGLGLAGLGALTFAAELLPVTSFTTRRGKSWRQYVDETAVVDEGYFLIGQGLQAMFPHGATLATNAAGIIPYVSGLRTIDMLGLNDVHIAHAPVALGRLAVGHEKHDGRYVLSRKPDVILVGLPVLHDQPLVDPGVFESAVAQWFRYFPGDEELVNAPGFSAQYTPIAAPTYDQRWFFAFVPRASVGPASP